MKALGRIALAAALLVPIGIVTANTAGATGGTASCHSTAAHAAGLVATPGFKYSTPQKQSYSLHTGTDTCPQPANTVVSSGTIVLKTAEPVAFNCTTIIGKKESGSSTGTITWNAGSGSSSFHGTIEMVSTSGTYPSHGSTVARLNGTINTSPANTLFAGEKVTGTLNLTPGLKSNLGGGACQQTVDLTTFNIVSSSFTVG